MSDEAETAPAQPRREPQVKADEDLNELIRTTLLRPDVNGDVATCAKILGLSYGRVERRAATDPYLKAMAAEGKTDAMVPPEESIIDRPPHMESLLPADQVRLVKGLVAQNNRVIKKGWRDIGLSDAEADAMEKAEQRSSLPIGRVLGASEGHMISLLAKSGLMLDQLGDQLINGEKSIHGPLPGITDMAGSDKTKLEFLKVFQSGAMVHMNLQNVLLKTRAATIDAMKKLKELQAGSAKPVTGTFEVETTNGSQHNE